jgi:uncharacterized membrane protein
MPILLGAFLIGIIAGSRALTAPMVVAWAAGLGWLPLEGTPLAFMGHAVTRYILTALALGEIVNDKLPATASRKVPPQFIARVVTGAFSGAAIGASQHSLLMGLILGGVGAVAGTLGGAWFRGALAKAFGKDLPAALIEDVLAVGCGFLIVSHLI